MKQNNKIHNQDKVGTFIGLDDLNDTHVAETRDAYQKNSGTYAEMWEWREGAIRKSITDLLNPYRRLIKAGDLVLVAGCGTGRDISYLNSHEIRCLGIDLSENMLVEATKRGVSSPLVTMDIRELKLVKESFEGIFCETALEHIPKRDIVKTFIGFYKVLKFEGCALFGFREGDGRVFMTDDIGGKRYFTTYTQDEAERIISQVGFKVINVLKANHMLSERPGFINFFVRKTK